MRTWIKFFAWLAAIVGAVGLVMHLLFFDVWKVPLDDPLLAASIEPTLSAGDLVVVMRRTSVARGELLRCTDPESPGRFVVARAIGRFGEQIELHDELVSLDGKRTPSPRACDPPAVTVHDPRIDDDVTLSCSQEDFGDMTFPVLRANERPEGPTKATVEATRWFLVSDDRHVHLDSRDYGQVDPETCQHVVFRILGRGGFADSRRRLTIIW
jgi:signal peptidase I